MLGAIGIFLYVGAEVSIGSFLVNYLSQPFYRRAQGSRCGEICGPVLGWSDGRAVHRLHFSCPTENDATEHLDWIGFFSLRWHFHTTSQGIGLRRSCTSDCGCQSSSFSSWAQEDPERLWHSWPSVLRSLSSLQWSLRRAGNVDSPFGWTLQLHHVPNDIHSCDRPNSVVTPVKDRASSAWRSSAAALIPVLQGAFADAIGIHHAFFSPGLVLYLRRLLRT